MKTSGRPRTPRYLTRQVIAIWIACMIAVPLASAAEGAAIDAGHVPSVLVAVRFRRHTSSPLQRMILEAAGARRESEIKVLRVAEVTATPSAISALRTNPYVMWVDAVGTVGTFAHPPNDPLVKQQWALSKIGAFRAWKAESRAGSPVTVAVVDTGVDRSHPDLQGRVTDGFDFINMDDDPSDDFGHGTHVAGIIAAQADNHKGIAGLSRGAMIMPIKALGANGLGEEYQVTAGIVYAVQHGAQVVNLSLGGPDTECPKLFDLAGRFAAQRGALLIAAAGNSGSKKDGNPVDYPAACDGYVAVGATDSTDAWASFSTHHDYVDLSAPGVGIVSTIPPSVAMEGDPATYGYGPADGTSMATPYVSGLAAMLLELHPDWSPEAVETRMEETAVDLGRKGRDPFFGSGRIDVARALGAS